MDEAKREMGETIITTVMVHQDAPTILPLPHTDCINCFGTRFVNGHACFAWVTKPAIYPNGFFESLK